MVLARYNACLRVAQVALRIVFNPNWGHSMRQLIAILSVAALAVACATDAGMQSGESMSPSVQAGATSGSAAPAARGPLVFADLPSFDRQLAESLSDAKAPVVVTSADHISLRQMPPRLGKWLAAVDASGGKIETVSVDPKEAKTRSLGLLFSLIGAIRQVHEYTKKQQYDDARNFDAKIFYKRDSKGDRVMDRVELVPRKR